LAPGFTAGFHGKIQDLRIVSDTNPTGGIKTADNAAFGVQPQGYGVTNRAAGTPG
jgi:hypothetical protein